MRLAFATLGLWLALAGCSTEEKERPQDKQDQLSKLWLQFK